MKKWPNVAHLKAIYGECGVINRGQDFSFQSIGPLSMETASWTTFSDFGCVKIILDLDILSCRNTSCAV